VYGAVLCSFFALQNPSLPAAIFHFGWQIETLAESFSWQEACLPLALERVRAQGIREKIFVPPNARRTIIKLYHEGMMEGHPGNKQTFYNVAKRHWWPKMQQDVAEYVKICNECQRNKERNHKPY